MRQTVCLLAVPQLQTVLQIAQKLVGIGEVMEILSADVLFIMQLLQRKKSASRSQPGFASPIYALEALNQELNIANAAVIDLHVDAGLRNFLQQALSAMAANLLAGLESGLYGDEIDFGPIHITAERRGQTHAPSQHLRQNGAP